MDQTERFPSLALTISTALGRLHKGKGVGRRQFGQCILKKAFFHWRRWFMFVQSSLYLCLPCSFPNEITQTKHHTQTGQQSPPLPFSTSGFYNSLVSSQKNIGWLVFCSVFKENSCCEWVLFVYGLCRAGWWSFLFSAGLQLRLWKKQTFWVAPHRKPWHLRTGVFLGLFT